MAKLRRFKIADGRHLVLPIGLLPAPGARNMRLHSGAIVELDFDDRRTQLHERFLNNRLKQGDLIEVDEAPATSEPEPLPAMPRRSGTLPPKFAVNPPKEG